MSTNDETVLACNLGAIDPAQRAGHETISDQIFASTLEIRELADGYGFRLPAETPMLYKVVEFVANERLCCPFFTFRMVVKDGQFWLELSGADEVKEVMKVGIVKPIGETGALSQEMKEIAKAGNPLSEIIRLAE